MYTCRHRAELEDGQAGGLALSIKFATAASRERLVESEGQSSMTTPSSRSNFANCARALPIRPQNDGRIEGLKNVETFPKVSELTGCLRGSAVARLSRARTPLRLRIIRYKN